MSMPVSVAPTSYHTSHTIPPLSGRRCSFDVLFAQLNGGRRGSRAQRAAVEAVLATLDDRNEVRTSYILPFTSYISPSTSDSHAYSHSQIVYRDGIIHKI